MSNVWEYIEFKKIGDKTVCGSKDLTPKEAAQKVTEQTKLIMENKKKPNWEIRLF